MGRQAIARPRTDAAVREALAPFVVSRLFVWMVAVVAAGVAGANPQSARSFDVPMLTHPLGLPFEALARWDSVWYLGVAHGGYDGTSTAFFPLYPLLVRALAPGGQPTALLFAAYFVSLVSLAGAFYLVRRLVELELGAVVARRSLLLLAFFPGALWLGVPYAGGPLPPP